MTHRVKCSVWGAKELERFKLCGVDARFLEVNAHDTRGLSVWCSERVEGVLSALMKPSGEVLGGGLKREEEEASGRLCGENGECDWIVLVGEEVVIDVIIKEGAPRLFERTKLDEHALVIKLLALYGDRDPPRMTVDGLALDGGVG